MIYHVSNERYGWAISSTTSCLWNLRAYIQIELLKSCIRRKWHPPLYSGFFRISTEGIHADWNLPWEIRRWPTFTRVSNVRAKKKPQGFCWSSDGANGALVVFHLGTGCPRKDARPESFTKISTSWLFFRVLVMKKVPTASFVYVLMDIIKHREKVLLMHTGLRTLAVWNSRFVSQ